MIPNPVTNEAYRACFRKIPYRSRKHAKDCAQTASKVHGRAFTPYRCKHCGEWHLATNKEAR